MKAPRIGITCDFETITDRRGAPSPRFVVPAAYVSAITAAGGHPLLLPHVAPERAAEVASLLDGVVISGGDFDVPPAYYGETPRPKLGTLLEERSAFERALLEAALSRGLPLLGVCGGMQLLNVVRGGTLYQDLSERAGTAQHIQPHDKREPAHSVGVAPGTRLASLVRVTTLQVNSTHHQLVRELGRGLVASAVSPDGVVEAIELPGAQFVLGVQWHPEVLRAPEHAAIYRGLVAACAG